GKPGVETDALLSPARGRLRQPGLVVGHLCPPQVFALPTELLTLHELPYRQPSRVTPVVAGCRLIEHEYMGPVAGNLGHLDLGTEYGLGFELARQPPAWFGLAHVFVPLL